MQATATVHREIQKVILLFWTVSRLQRAQLQLQLWVKKESDGHFLLYWLHSDRFVRYFNILGYVFNIQLRLTFFAQISSLGPLLPSVLW